MAGKESLLEKLPCPRAWILSLLFIAALFVFSAEAEEDPEMKELIGVKKKIHALRIKAEELEAKGMEEKAHALRQKAKALHEKIGASHERRERSKSKEHDKLEEILHGLEHGMVALKRLGRHEELETLERVANGVRRKIHGHKEAQEEKRRHGAEKERQVARKQIEVMRMALPALREAGRKDSAELVERAIRAREVNLEGRRDEEAQEIRKMAPTLGQQVELFTYAAKLWSKFKHEEKAETLKAFAGQLRKKFERTKKSRAKGEREPRKGKGDRAERERASSGQKQARRMKALEKRFAELQKEMKEIRSALHKMKKQRNK